MKRILLKVTLAVCMAAGLSACMENTRKTPEFQWGGEIIGAVKRYGEGKNVDIIMDNLDTVRTVNTTDLDPVKFPDGIRVVSHVYMNERTVVGGHYVFNSMIDNIAPIPVKKVLDLSYVNSDSERVDSVGNDAITVTKAVVSGYYLDVRYSYFYDSKASKKHNITLVADDEKSDNSTLFLAIRHNADNDEGTDIVRGLLSCDIKKYLDKAKDGKLQIKFIYNDGTVERNETITWVRPDYMN